MADNYQMGEEFYVDSSGCNVGDNVMYGSYLIAMWHNSQGHEESKISHAVYTTIFMLLVLIGLVSLVHTCRVLRRATKGLQALVESGRFDDLINTWDGYGNTILHLATSLKQMEILMIHFFSFRAYDHNQIGSSFKFLSSKATVAVNKRYENGLTALDITQHLPRDLKVMENRKFFQSSRVLEARTIPQMGWGARSHQPNRRREIIPLEVKRHNVTAVMAYQAGLNPPSRVWQDDVHILDSGTNATEIHHPEKLIQSWICNITNFLEPNGTKEFLPGAALLVTNCPRGHLFFWICNTVSFLASSDIVLLLESGLPSKKRIVMWILMTSMWVTLTFIALTYLISMVAITVTLSGPFSFTFYYCLLSCSFGELFSIVGRTVVIIAFLGPPGGVACGISNTLQQMLDERSNHAPTKTYVGDAKAIAATPADVKEYNDSYVLIVDMPGLKSGDVKVQVEDANMLVISGERKREEEKDGVKYLRMERRVGKFMRKFALPENANVDDISAVCQDGVLTVTVKKLPPPEPKKPKTIEVKIA
ncbi:Alpha crystallin/Hsp20 domain [Dillenia turbinata]|uniref:Alpha crystallin/Hsp20 domain n=1 Tax=Dillenia turbinata TaxID=194707 RepID=A0AAN8ZS35_9MAGN